MASKTRAALHLTLPLSVHTKLLGSLEAEARSALLPVLHASCFRLEPVQGAAYECADVYTLFASACAM